MLSPLALTAAVIVAVLPAHTGEVVVRELITGLLFTASVAAALVVVPQLLVAKKVYVPALAVATEGIESVVVVTPISTPFLCHL